MIPQETVNLILETAQIVDVVSDYVTLKRRGASYVACCPFHNEKTPSFYVTPSKGIYKCFGCGKAGSAVNFVMEEEHCTYPEALRYLAKKYNIEIQEKEETPEEIASRQRNESLLLVTEFAAKFFVEQLKTQEGQSVAMAYYRKRGIEDETMRKFCLGWAPSGRSELTDAALKAGYKLEYLIDAGLTIKHEDGSLTDKFRARVMFPIHSVSGRIVAFSGRTLSEDNPAKYVNSPETEIFVKSRNLLGIYLAKSEISRIDSAILVEGNVDVTMMHQLGITNVVASCGTSLTEEQVRLIHRFTENVTIMYDGDSAGIHATQRALPMFLSENMNVRIVLLPDGDDPDSFSRKHTLDEVKEFIVDNAEDGIRFRREYMLREAGDDPQKLYRVINDIADTIASIPDPAKRAVYVTDSAQALGVEESILYNRIKNFRRSMLEAKRREDERRRRQEESGEPQSSAFETVTETLPQPVAAAWREENRTLGPVERDLLRFLLVNGCDPLVFEPDSEYYSGELEQPKVAVFIRDALEADDTHMANSVYAQIYDGYMSLYDTGLTQQEIVARLLDSPDKILAEQVAQLSTDKYLLTVEKFQKALTVPASWLTTYVPRTLMLYAERRVQDKIDSLRHSLKEVPEDEQAGILQEMMRFQKARDKIAKKLNDNK